MSDERRDHKLVIAEIIGVAAATTVAYTVPAGNTARVVGAWCYHDHAAGSLCQFLVSDTLTTKEVGVQTNIASTTGRHSLYASGELPDGLILHGGWQLIAYGASIGAGEHIYMTYLVELRKGESSKA